MTHADEPRQAILGRIQFLQTLHERRPSDRSVQRRIDACRDALRILRAERERDHESEEYERVVAEGQRDEVMREQGRAEGRREERERVDTVYRERAQCIAGLCRMAVDLGYPCGLGRHHPDPDPQWDPDWLNVVYIDLPSGQVSWHIAGADLPLFDFLPSYRGTWDGHSTDEKYRRLTERGDHWRGGEG